MFIYNLIMLMSMNIHSTKLVLLSELNNLIIKIEYPKVMLDCFYYYLIITNQL